MATTFIATRAINTQTVSYGPGAVVDLTRFSTSERDDLVRTGGIVSSAFVRALATQPEFTDGFDAAGTAAAAVAAQAVVDSETYAAKERALLGTIPVAAVGTVVDDCSTTAPWSRFVLGGATVTQMTDDPRFPYYLRLAGTAVGGTARVGRDLSIDLSAGGALSFWLRVSDANLAYMSVTLNAKDYTGTPTLGWPSGNGIQSPRSTNMDSGRWHRIVIDLTDVAQSGADRVTDADAICGLLINWTSTGGNTSTIDVADFRTHPSPAIGPRVLWWTDDGFASTYSVMYPALAAVGHHGTVAVDRNKPGTANYMTVAQITELEAAGWDIVGHDSNDYTGRTEANVEIDLRASVKYMRDNGWRRGARHWSWPQGGRNALCQGYADRHFLTSRRVVPWANSLYPGVMDPTNPGLFYVTATKSLATVQAALDATVASNTTRILVFHDFVASGATDTQWTIADFQALVTYADSIGLKSIRLSDMYPHQL